ncbi:MAG: hypothetical protein IT438_14045 [Phycisphaerales bacterium]|nr:hypothetical protein [Phycisphaerales bacterium]
MPTLPYWPGLLANTAFWGLPLPLLVLATTALRRARRQRRGLCTTCAYDLSAAASPVCPECGLPRPPTSAASSKTSPAAG